jgi:hypothetical protein
VTRNDGNHENHLAVLSALSQVSTDPGQLVALLAAAEDDEAAVRLLREAYDFTPVQAQAVLDAQFRLLTYARRDAVDTGLRDVRDALAAPWDPPLEVRATVRPPGAAELVIAGVEHRVDGKDLYDCLERVASLVREKLARPQRRRAAVGTGLTEGPTRILVDPVGAVEFVYDDADEEP